MGTSNELLDIKPTTNTPSDKDADRWRIVQQQDEFTPTHSSASTAKCQSAPAIRRIEPPSDLLARIASFLPQMESSNNNLFSQLQSGAMDHKQIDMEDIPSDDEQVIEMVYIHIPFFRLSPLLTKWNCRI